MKRFLALMFIFVLLLSSCSTLEHIDVEGDETKSQPVHESGDVIYVANLNTRSYHTEDCYLAKRIKEENKWETFDLDFLISREFTPCKRCIKE